LPALLVYAAAGFHVISASSNSHLIHNQNGPNGISETRRK